MFSGQSTLHCTMRPSTLLLTLLSVLLTLLSMALAALLLVLTLSSLQGKVENHGQVCPHPAALYCSTYCRRWPT